MRRCRAFVSSLEPGFSGLLVGFSRLAASGLLDYSEEIAAPATLVEGVPWHLQSRDFAAMKLLVDDQIRCHLDVHDSWEIDRAAYNACDLYFKRSYDPYRLSPREFPRLRPLGLIHDVERDGIDLRALRRVVSLRGPRREQLAQLRSSLLTSLASTLHLGPRPTESMMRSRPEPGMEPQVLFMVGLWDPGIVPLDRPDKAAEFEAINEMRVACVRRLRKTFGGRFTGGVMHSDFARRRYPDALLDDPRGAAKRAYIARVRRSAICIATTGLHGSNGWKLAEYVALSRAIVSEPLRYSVPGDFSAPANYLPFRSADECASQVQRLMDDAALRVEQMHENYRYAERYMRPPALARYVLDTAVAA